ncbi:hypothetical protein [Haliscomenobacter sp.]|uniref:hypothetical protein n=1 Tax=Haliscomenobacter sp. TaxID=2717303 RepID=UPI003BA86AA8
MNEEEQLDLYGLPTGNKADASLLTNIHYVRRDLLIVDRDNDLLYGNWAATIDYACEFIYQNRAINISRIVSSRRVASCGGNEIWMYEHN